MSPNINAEILSFLNMLSTQKPNWDDDGAKVTNIVNASCSIFFLNRIAEEVYNRYELIICAPKINPCRDGSVDISFRHNKVRMLFNVRQKNYSTYISYYGDIAGQLPIKNIIEISDNCEELYVWMKNLYDKEWN